jgi:hypothetical protein
MTRAVIGLRSVFVAGMVAALGGLAGCGDDGVAGSASNVSTNTGLIDRGTTTPAPADGTQTPVSGQPPVSGTANTVTLSWEAPTENADGSALMDLKGYKVHYGSASKSYSDVIKVANPGLTTYVVQNLPTGTYYFAITAYNATGSESSLSGEVSTQVD